ncbi:MAG: GTP pyrophosphokinase family protein [Lachnospiraceae bacterium]|jgi:ppGpp synthetase/RelA/SpoT-type nucleotidyltranferase|nr:GTP pyrophosphokinase family protein [Lachnospiraceae bacterium]
MNAINKTTGSDSAVSIYGTSKPLLEETMQMVLREITKIRNEMTEELGMDPIEHLLGRIKSEESMREKCRRKGLPETPESALEKIHDAIGLRVVCAFLDDVYTIRDRLLALPRIRLVEEKDYIRHVKPNGYRSFHMIIIVDEKIYAEIQLRTISMDTWAALEHHLKYKKEIGRGTALISAELKRCADELASTDSSMQTLRDMIQELR